MRSSSGEILPSLFVSMSAELLQGVVAPAFDGVLHLPRHGQVRLAERVQSGRQWRRLEARGAVATRGG